jgi:uncharacterized protein
MSRSPFLFNVADLRRERALARAVSVAAPVEWGVEMSRVLADPPLDAELELSALSGGIRVHGTATVTVHHTCHRCLEEWDEEVGVPVDQLYVEASRADDDDYAFSGDQIDLEPMLRDEVLLAMPLVPTCPEGCEGLVDSPQTDLNTPTPEEQGETSSPFAVLKDLLDEGQ